MVFFNCNACGEALKKNQVEKHYQTKCRRCEVLSCVDCQKEFWGDTYKEHIKCISEEEKYSGKNWKPKANANKGEQKQEAWTEQVMNAIASCPSAKPQLKQLLQKIRDYPNIPRKKAKFENFVKNSMRVRETYLVTEAWDVISAEISKPEPSERTSHNGISNGNIDPPNDPTSSSEASATTAEPTSKKLSKRERKEERQKKQHKTDKKKRKPEKEAENSVEKKANGKGSKRSREAEEVEENEEGVSEEPRKKKKKKKKSQDMDDEPADTSLGLAAEPQDEVAPVEQRGPFQWEDAIIEVLTKASDHEVTLKKMKKKVLAEFHACGGDGKTYTDDKLFSRLNKHILRNPRLKVHKERVKLLH